MDKLKWLAINSIPRLGPRRIAELFRSKTGLDKFFSQDYHALSQALGVSVALAKEYCSSIDLAKAQRQLERCTDLGIGILTLECKSYPKLLAQIHDPPPVLYYWGRLPAQEVLLGVVGSRKATSYGRNVTGNFVKGLTQAGFGIVSGLARGIDQIAHQACLDAGGYTIAVLGNGVDISYPASNMGLQRAIKDKGCIISEFAPGVGPKASHFPRRNRIISGLSQGVLVVEAAIKSGAMITVGFALEQGRDVFSVPGNITSAQSSGTNHLIRLGAKPALNTRDILEEYGLNLPLVTGLDHEKEENSLEKLEIDEQKIYDLIDAQGITVDEICYITGLTGRIVLSTLVALELKGLIHRLSGQKYVRSNGTEV